MTLQKHTERKQKYKIQYLKLHEKYKLINDITSSIY